MGSDGPWLEQMMAREDEADSATDALVAALAPYSPAAQERALVRVLRRVAERSGAMPPLSRDPHHLRPLSVNASTVKSAPKAGTFNKWSCTATDPVCPRCGHMHPPLQRPTVRVYENTLGHFSEVRTLYSEAPSATPALGPKVEGTFKSRIEAFLAQNPGASVKQIALGVYGADSHENCNKARALLHQMRNQERVQSTENGRWWAAAMAVAAAGVGAVATLGGPATLAAIGAAATAAGVAYAGREQKEGK